MLTAEFGRCSDLPHSNMAAEPFLVILLTRCAEKNFVVLESASHRGVEASPAAGSILVRDDWGYKY